MPIMSQLAQLSTILASEMRSMVIPVKPSHGQRYTYPSPGWQESGELTSTILR
jgi:hypothetical protein